jgi:quercetin dioxygenase-like cupin family protein
MSDVPAERRMTPMDVLFRDDRQIPREVIHAVEGVKEPEGMYLKVLMVTEQMLVFRAWKQKGVLDPWQQHDDHESVATLIEGKLRMWIGDKEFLCRPGDVWHHPQGVRHMSEALEDCVLIEIKSPARKTWT